MALRSVLDIDTPRRKRARVLLYDSDFYVYVLFRPWNGTPCYVGKGKGRRWKGHDRLNTSHYNRHLASIYKKAGGPLICVKVRECLTEDQAFEVEKALIAVIGRGKHLLANMTDGGDGAVNLDAVNALAQSVRMKARFADPEKLAAHSERLKRYFSDPEVRAAHSIQQKEALAKPEARQRMRDAHLGKKIPRDVVEKQRSANTGKKRSPEFCKAMSLLNTGRQYSEETRRKIGNAARGRPRTIEAVNKAKITMENKSAREKYAYSKLLRQRALQDWERRRKAAAEEAD